MNTEIITEKEEANIQYILNENGELAEILKEDAKKVEYPLKYPLKNAFEVFVRVKGTENYWISNYGRCVDNYKSKIRNAGCNKLYEHKQGKCHYTIYEIERYAVKNAKGQPTGKIEVSSYKRETMPELLVAETFLARYKDRIKVWHKDGKESNNWYKNLITVTPQDYKNLKSGNVNWQELNLEQEYIEYENEASVCAYRIYKRMLIRCKSTKESKHIHKCYNNTTMCQEWLDNPKAFIQWYLTHYYNCGDEPMHIDKDLFGNGADIYHPDCCCILPQGLNTLLTNCKKHYKEGETSDNVLPLGVRYNSKTRKYSSEITFTGAENTISLSEWDTAEEAFAEYKIMKQADILMMAAKYKESIPEYIYKELLKIEVKPY